MISAIFSKKWIIYKAALKRLKWLSILYAVGLFLELPLPLWMQISRQKAEMGAAWVAGKSFRPDELFNPFLHVSNVAAAVIAGLIIFSYLHKDRANTFFHSLPIKRAALYIQNVAAGLTLLWLPILVNGVIIYGVFALFGIDQVQAINHNQVFEPGITSLDGNQMLAVVKLMAFWFFLSLLMTALFYVFTVFMGMLTGNILLQGGLTLLGLFLPLGLYLLVKYNLWKMLYGYPRDMGNQIEWFSPLISYLENSSPVMFEKMGWYLGYLAAALIILVVSIYLYNKRHAESAGETLAADWIRWVFKYGVAVCSALTGGLYFGSLNENSMGALYTGYAIGGLLGYVVADMIAYKSFHFYKRWKGLLTFAAVFALVIGCIRLDLWGYENYVPDQAKIKGVSLGNFTTLGGEPLDSSYPGMRDPQNINLVRQLHGRIIQMRDQNKAAEQEYYYGQKTAVAQSAAWPVEQQRRIAAITIKYELTNGSQVTRVYNIDLNAYRQYLNPIFNTQEAKKIIFSRFFRMDPKKMDEITVNNFHLGKSIRIYQKEEVQAALTALQKDLLDVTYESAVEGKTPALASIDFSSKMDYDGGYMSYSMNLYKEFSNLRTFLKQHNYTADLFLAPEQVDHIAVKKVNTEATVKVKDKQDIQTLLEWCGVTDQQSYFGRQKGPEGKVPEQYFGQIVKKDGSSIYVAFDISPYALQHLKQIIAKK
ncbi:MAG TPA: DUF6449 domain-containing protein [Bacillota bacterium]|nr:DUF6449 domain-containing protein [Bacillota bacterium]